MENYEFIKSDAPKQTFEEDSLGRKKFIENFAKALNQWPHSENSLIVGLHGEWGSGKTSIKNMAIDLMKKPDIGFNKPLIIEFNPWHWYKHAELTKAFFREIVVSLGKPNLDEQYKKLALEFAIYGLIMSCGIATLPALNSLLGYSSVGIFACLYSLKEFFTYFSEFNRLKRKLIAKTLEEIKNKLKTELQKLKAPLLVIIDDLDRLPSAAEVHNILQLVKGNADFPNIVYVLIFNKPIVEKMLTIESSSGNKLMDGNEYLKKIILVPFDLPSLDPNTLKKELSSRLQKIRQSAGFPTDACEEWNSLYDKELHVYFKTLRDVNRYCASLTFYSSIFKNDSCPEIHWTDLAVLEVLRLFEPAIYNRIFQEKALLTFSHEVEPEYKQKFYEEIKKISKSTAAINILESLFKIYDDNNSLMKYVETSSSQDIRPIPDTLRVSNPLSFDRYFQFTIPDWDVSESEKQLILSLTNNLKVFLDKCNELHSQNRLTIALSRIQADIARLSKDQKSNLVIALLAVGENSQPTNLSEEEFDVLNQTIEACFAIIHETFVTQTEDHINRLQFIQEILNQKSDYFFIFFKLIKIEDDFWRNFSFSATKIIESDIKSELDRLKSLYFRKLEKELALSGANMINTPKFAELFGHWYRWDKPSAENWLNNSIFQIPKGCASLLNAFSYGFDGSHALKTWLEPHNLQKLCNKAQKEALEHHKLLTEDGIKILNALKESFKTATI